MSQKKFNELYDLFVTFDKAEVTTLFQQLGVEPLSFFTGDIPQYAYYHNFGLKDININPSIELIGRSAFSNSGVQAVNFDSAKSLRYIERSAFERCDIKWLLLPFGIKEIAQYVCYECSELERVELPRSVETIAKSCFEGCEKLTYVYMTNNVKEVQAGAFADCGFAGNQGLVIDFAGTKTDAERLIHYCSASAFDRGTKFNCLDGVVII
jgi:hypothetical protein